MNHPRGSNHRIALVALCFPLLWGAGVDSTAQDTVAITEFLNESIGTELTGEWTELYNYGNSPVSLLNWRISDEDGESFTFPDVTIEADDYLILARDKTGFEALWLGGVPNSKVVHISIPDSFRLGGSGDELILRNSSGTIVWQVAYRDDETLGRATFLTEDDFAATVYGSKAAPGVNRNGNDVTDTLGYEGNNHSEDPHAYFGGIGDFGSPLRGHYGSGPKPPPPFVIDASSSGAPFDPGVRGMAIADNTINRTTYLIAIPQSLEVARGSALRGVAAGLYADLYDWRVRNNEPRPPTLEFLRYARDTNANLFITVNTRGLVEPDPLDPTKTRYYDTEIDTLAPLAGDWVHYVNRIAQTYRQGDLVTDASDAAILGSLVWSSTYPGDSFDTLLAPEEAPVPKVVYWEIGNEPTVSVSGSIGVSNGFTLTAAEYYERYKAITAAMKAEDPTIKVGPCIVNGDRSDEHLIALLSDPAVPVDFISYHPYGRMGDRNTAEEIEVYLGGVLDYQREKYQEIRDLIVSCGRDPASVEMVASEVNVSYWSYNDTEKEGQMAHALGSIETVFTFARLGLTASHYWIWPAHAGDGTEYPNFMAFEKLRDYMGDQLLGTHSIENRLRLYATRSSATGTLAIWALNFSNTLDETLNLRLQNLGTPQDVRLLRLEDPSAPTTLFSAILSPSQPGGPRADVEWTEMDLQGTRLSDFDCTFPAATLSLILVSQAPPTGVSCAIWRTF